MDTTAQYTATPSVLPTLSPNIKMAISSSSDWPFACIYSYRKSHKIAFTSPCKTLSCVSVPCSNLRVFYLNSSNCPSPILEEPSTNVPVVELGLKFGDSGQSLLPDTEHLNDFLCGVLQSPKTEELAYEYYKSAKEKPEFRPEKSMLRLLIRYLIRSEKWDLFFPLADDFMSYRVLPDSYTCSRLVSGCIRARKFKLVDRLLEVFKSDGKIAVFAFDSAMRGYNKLHMFRTTIDVYERMRLAGIAPDSGCYSLIMKAYHKVGDTEKVVTLFHEFENRELDSTRYLGQIHRIFCESLGASGRAFEALEFFRGVKKKGVLEDPMIYSSLICSFASMRNIEVAEELFKEAEEKKMLRDPALFLKLVLMYVETGLMEKSLEVVRAMKSAKINVSDCIFCAIVNGFSKKRGFRAAVKVYEELISEGCEPGQVTYASIINAYYRIGLHSDAERVFLEMEQKGFDKCVVAYSSMVAIYGKTGRLRDAMRLVAKMKAKGCQPNVWIYNSLMEMHGRVKNMRQVEKIWKEMKRRKVMPDKVSYTSVISAYNKAKEFEVCVRLFHEYRMNRGEVDRVMAGIMVGVFTKLNRIDDLVKLLQDMKSEGTQLDRRLYLSALNALRDAGLQSHTRWLQESFEPT